MTTSPFVPQQNNSTSPGTNQTGGQATQAVDQFSASGAQNPVNQSIHNFNYSNFAGQTSAAGGNTATGMKGTPNMKAASKVFLPLCLVVIIGGALTGLGLNKLSAKGSGDTFEGQTITKTATNVASIQNGQIFGSADASSFKDNAEGYLEAGGIDGEGSQHLLRAGGASQTVYLTSSVTDLSKFEGMQVKVWGETFKGQKAGWLMDVGRVQVQNTKGTAPQQ
jgi:hypothetical protein